MSQVGIGNDGANDLAVLMRLFGPPPLLSHEKFEHFQEMMSKLIACMRPENFVVSMLVYQVGIETWRAMRWTRFQAQMINRWGPAARESELLRAKLKDRRKVEKEGPPELYKSAENEAARRFALEPSIERVYDDCKTAIATAEEIDLVVAVERGINTLQKVEPLISEALKRRNDALYQIEWHRVSLARDLRKKSDAIIEGECKEVKTAPSIVPPISGNELGS